MSKLVTGILGPFKGKIGPVVGATWKGIPYMRAKPKKRSKRKRISEKEQTNRNKFAMSQAWLQPLLVFVRIGFKGYTPTVEGFVAAKSFLLKNAMETTDGVTIINPSKVQVSFGDLPLPENIKVERVGESELLFTWDPTPADYEYRLDQCMLLAYDIENGVDISKRMEQFRYTGKDSLTIVPGNRNYHVYIAFVAADRSRQSHSVYLGEINT